jgi:hypothetical protein
MTSVEFPRKWKRAQIKPIPKIFAPTQMKDYRPISLLFHLGKLSEEVIINKMKIKQTEIVDINQYAYKPNIGTVDALILLLDDFSKDLDKASTKFTQLAGVDFSKAFDRLQPNLLVNKMRGHCFNENITTLVADFLSDRFQFVRFSSNHSSSFIPSNVGTPQGTKLGPILWLIYGNNFLQAV